MDKFDKNTFRADETGTSLINEPKHEKWTTFAIAASFSLNFILL